MLASHVGDRVNDSIGIDGESYVVAFIVFNIFRDEFLVSDAFLNYCLWKCILGSFDVIINHIVEQRASNADWKIEFRQFIF